MDRRLKKEEKLRGGLLLQVGTYYTLHYIEFNVLLFFHEIVESFSALPVLSCV